MMVVMMVSRTLGRLLYLNVQSNKTNFMPAARLLSISKSEKLESLEYVTVSKAGVKNNIGVITLNHANVLNILCNDLIIEMNNALDVLEADSAIGAIIITGNEKAFAAGMDLKEMSTRTYAEYLSGNFDHWCRVSKIVKPVIAAVDGYVIGGGCELAMMCDIIYAGENAKFALPEILFGSIPGGGGTQRLPRRVGKSKAMEIILTGNQVPAQEAERMGLVSKVFPTDKLFEEAVKLGDKIANNSQVLANLAKQSINAAFENTLKQGLHVERCIVRQTFATKDQKEGMAAFIEKRPPNFVNE